MEPFDPARCTVDGRIDPHRFGDVRRRRHRQVQLGVDALLGADLVEQDVATAGAAGDAQHGGANGPGREGLVDLIANGLPCRGLHHRGKSRLRAVGLVDHVAGEKQHPVGRFDGGGGRRARPLTRGGLQRGQHRAQAA